jgi:hypothetical protein
LLSFCLFFCDEKKEKLTKTLFFFHPLPHSDKKEKPAPTAAKHEKKEHGKPLTHDEPTSDEWATGAHGRAAGALETKEWSETMYTAPN